MDSLRIALIIIASLVLIGLLIHGFIINKKERSPFLELKKDNNHTKETAFKSDFIDDDIGEVRVISTHSKSLEQPIIVNDSSSTIQIKTKEPTLVIDNERVISTEQLDPSLSNQLEKVKTLSKIEEIEIELEEKIKKDDENKKNNHQVTHKNNPEIVTVDNESADNHSQKEENQTQTKEKQYSESDDVQEVKDFIVLYILGLNGELIKGDLLLSSLSRQDFKFGKMNIFHRYANENGPVLFSLANMIKPGTFDKETMHELNTMGLSIFMGIPSCGDTFKNFNLMLQSAQSIADDVNGIVVDDEQCMITPQKIAYFRNKIKQIIQ